MKRPLHLSSLILLLLGCAARSTGETAPPVGGQSGDDGDAVPDPGPPAPVPPGLPDPPCDPQELEVAWDDATSFGGSALDALNRLAPNASVQLYWVPFDSLPDTSFRPGPGPTSLALGIGARADAAVKHVSWTRNWPDASCPDEALQLPVQLELKSADGALDLEVEGLLELSSGSAGHLSAELPAGLGGSFRFEQIAGGDGHWKSIGFNLAAELWLDGSRGEINPSFELDQSAPPAGAPPPPPAAPAPAPAGSATPSVPDHWRSIAVWPQRENCDGESRGTAGVYQPGDRAIGLSIADVVSDLNSRPDWTLLSGERALPVQFTLDLPSGAQCVRRAGRTMSFDVAASLRAVDATGAPLEHLAARSIFELTATSTLEGGALERLRWVRRDLLQPQSRAAFEAGTGITLDASEQYQQIWWSWHGTQTRSPTQLGSTSGALLVSSLNAQQAAESARVVAQGGPGPGISFDATTQFPVLPGDSLLAAGIAAPGGVAPKP
jgi:hypothetical protein